MGGAKVSQSLPTPLQACNASCEKAIGSLAGFLGGFQSCVLELDNE